MIPTLADAEARDAGDQLGHFRARFELPPEVIYLDGNSLGALPLETPDRLEQVVREQWGKGLIGSWNTARWIEAPQTVGGKIAQLIGAAPDEVIVADSTSVNLYKLLAAALLADAAKHIILTEPGNFPTDLYIARGLAALRPGVSVRTVSRDEITAAAGPETLVLLTHVHYKTGARFDLAETTRAIRARGGTIVWDLSHSVGAVPLALGDARVELAVGCGYKYLNGGPGAPAFLYVARHLQTTLHSPLTGWMGHAAPFAFDNDYAPAPDLRRFLCGTPPILGIAALDVGVDLTLEAGMPAVARKSSQLCDLFIACLDETVELALITPRDSEARGSHVSYAHPEGYAVMQALIARGIIGDFRAPDVIRFGITPLYTRFADVWHAARILREILADRAWDNQAYRTRAAVT